MNGTRPKQSSYIPNAKDEFFQWVKQTWLWCNGEVRYDFLFQLLAKIRAFYFSLKVLSTSEFFILCHKTFTSSDSSKTPLACHLPLTVFCLVRVLSWLIRRHGFLLSQGVSFAQQLTWKSRFLLTQHCSAGIETVHHIQCASLELVSF